MFSRYLCAPLSALQRPDGLGVMACRGHTNRDQAGLVPAAATVKAAEHRSSGRRRWECKVDSGPQAGESILILCFPPMAFLERAAEHDLDAGIRNM